MSIEIEMKTSAAGNKYGVFEMDGKTYGAAALRTSDDDEHYEVFQDDDAERLEKKLDAALKMSRKMLPKMEGLEVLDKQPDLPADFLAQFAERMSA